jgi:hypothetical protein
MPVRFLALKKLVGKEKIIMEKMNTATAYRMLKSPNKKTRKRALRAIKDSKRK